MNWCGHMCETLYNLTHTHVVSFSTRSSTQTRAQNKTKKAENFQQKKDETKSLRILPTRTITIHFHTHHLTYSKQHYHKTTTLQK
mmetsp:Transcript_26102/g.37836  ORF Transcript_26102/g.37836 Transcript_26102/m.37836 type:complete len:85 (+) Transcript_26102:267-521(+)